MNVFRKFPMKNISAFCFPSTRLLHKTSINNTLQEFFDDEKNWGSTEVKSGRSWRLEELRIKSNTDLHKLWYVLLKERNMLLTMEEECMQETRLFPSPERIDKVADSMDNIEAVVKERNSAYHLLERGQVGIRETKKVTGVLGLEVEHTEEEHLIPKEQNAKWLQEHQYDPFNKDIRKFRTVYREQEARKKRNTNTRDFNHVIGLLKRFPNLDLEAVKEQYPSVDIEKAKNSRKYRGHFVTDMYNFK